MKTTIETTEFKPEQKPEVWRCQNFAQDKMHVYIGFNSYTEERKCCCGGMMYPKTDDK